LPAAVSGVGFRLFCPFRPLPPSVGFALTRVTLFEIPFTLRLLTLPFSRVFLALPSVVVLLALVLALPFVFEVAVWTARDPHLAKVDARSLQLVP
jgi:hypothetical protein